MYAAIRLVLPTIILHQFFFLQSITFVCLLLSLFETDYASWLCQTEIFCKIVPDILTHVGSHFFTYRYLFIFKSKKCYGLHLTDENKLSESCIEHLLPSVDMTPLLQYLKRLSIRSVSLTCQNEERSRVTWLSITIMTLSIITATEV